MAIGTNDLIDKFGTQDTVTIAAGTTQITNAGFSSSADVVAGAWTNDDDAPVGGFVVTGTFATSPSAGAGLNIYGRRMNIDGTSDQPLPDANFNASFLASIVVDASTAAQTVSEHGSLPNLYTSQVYEFYVENDTTGVLQDGWTLKVTPITQGPSA